MYLQLAINFPFVLKVYFLIAILISSMCIKFFIFILIKYYAYFTHIFFHLQRIKPASYWMNLLSQQKQRQGNYISE